MSQVLGAGTGNLRETVEIFRENREAGAQRGALAQQMALRQFGEEFQRNGRSWFDRMMDAVNRLPRPGLALGTLGLFGAAMVDPVWFASRMQGLALVPDALWWLLGAIVSFYFGARHQAKGQEFQMRLGQTLGQVPQVLGSLKALQDLRHPLAGTGTDATVSLEAVVPEDNPALTDWRKAG